MKIMQVNNVYDFGSTGKITRDIHLYLLENGYDSVVLYGRRYHTKDPHVSKICSEFYGKAQNGLYRITGIKYGGCFLSTRRIIERIKKESPDIVHLQCLNGHFVNIYKLLNFLKASHIHTVITLHAEFMYTGGCSHSIECEQWRDYYGCGNKACPQYRHELKSQMGDKSALMWNKMKEAFEGFNDITIVSVSPWLMNRAQQSHILAEKKHIVIYNGIDTKIFCGHPKSDNDKTRKKFGYSSNNKIVFHATPLFDDNPNNIKGGYYVKQLAYDLPEVQFLVAGKYDSNIRVPKNVQLLGSINDKKLLSSLYSMADLTLLTSKRETFSMVSAESLCCGTPIVGFKSGGPEMISLPQFSSFCEYGNTTELSLILTDWLSKEKPQMISEEAIKEYDKKRMLTEYLRVYQDINNSVK